METVHKNETLKFLKVLVESFESPKLTYLHQQSTQEVRFIPKYLDIETELKQTYFNKRAKIKKLGKKNAEIYEKTLKRAIFLEFNNDKEDLYLNIVADRNEAKDFISLSENINNLNNKKIFNHLKDADNNKYYFHQIQLLNGNELKELESNKDLRETKLISLFKIYVPIFLKRLDILFPEPY